VLAAIKFDYDPTLEASEVQNEIAVRVLPAKLAVFELAAAQALPKPVFSIGRRVAQSTLQSRLQYASIGLASHIISIRRDHHHPHPTLSLKGRA